MSESRVLTPEASSGPQNGLTANGHEGTVYSGGNILYHAFQTHRMVYFKTELFICKLYIEKYRLKKKGTMTWLFEMTAPNSFTE